RDPLPHADHRARVGSQLRRGHERGRRVDPAAALQDRRPLRDEADPHRAREGLCPRGAVTDRKRRGAPPFPPPGLPPPAPPFPPPCFPPRGSRSSSPCRPWWC